MSRDPLDLTLREVLLIYGESLETDMKKEDIATDFDKPLNIIMQDVFSEIHPANASQLLRDLSNGIDKGYTAQGSFHPDFQRTIQSLQKDPEDLYKSDG